MLKKIIDAKEITEKIIKAKIILAEGSVPRNIGTFMLVSKNYLFGTIGGGQLEHQITNISKKSFILSLTVSLPALCCLLIFSLPPNFKDSFFLSFNSVTSFFQFIVLS